MTLNIMSALSSTKEWRNYIEAGKKILSWEYVPELENMIAVFNKSVEKRYSFSEKIQLSRDPVSLTLTYWLDRLNKENNWEKIEDELWITTERVKWLVSKILA